MLKHFFRLVAPRHEHRLLALVLITLHLALWWDFNELLPRLFLVCHFILVILWQPLWGRREPLNARDMILLSMVIITFIVFVNNWLISIWQIMLIGLMGGRDLVKPKDRFANMVAIVTLLLNLFIINFYQFILTEDSIVYWYQMQDFYVKYSLLLLPSLLFFITTDNSLEHRYHIDFFHGLTLSLLMIIIALGSLVLVYGNVHASYPSAIFQMSLLVALFVLSIGWLWTALAGEGRIDQLWTQHLFNISGSFERWLNTLAQPSNYKALTSKEFLDVGFQQLGTLPWVAGIAWHSLQGRGEGQFGETEKHCIVIVSQTIEVTVYSYYRIGSSHHFHIQLLVQLLDYFHQVKLREESFAQKAHLQAIHETGAKLTHDIKNLLQILCNISSIIESSQPVDFSDTQRILQGQMPHLTMRLKRTLDKLEKPAELTYLNREVKTWWANLQARYRNRTIHFHTHLTEADNTLVPEELFDNVADNLLENALNKRTQEPNINIEVTLCVTQKQVQLTVCDTGSKIPDDIARVLMTQVVSSKEGYGIGLYQAAKQASHAGYRFFICSNFENNVCFEINNI